MNGPHPDVRFLARYIRAAEAGGQITDADRERLAEIAAEPTPEEPGESVSTHDDDTGGVS